MTGKEKVKNLQRVFADYIVHIYAAARLVRDMGTKRLNEGISNPKERAFTKNAWRGLNEFCKAYEDCFPNNKVEDHG